MSNPKKYDWYKIAGSLAELQFANNLAIIQANDKTLTLAQFGEQLYACAHKCPHASGILADGFIDAAGNITCPLHRYKFNLQNGRNITGEGYYLKTYPVEAREDGIYIGFEHKSLFGWL